MLKFSTFHFLVNELPGTGGGDKYSLSHTFESTSHKRFFLKLPLIKHLHRLYCVFIQGFPFLISYSFHCCRAEGSRDPTLLFENRRRSLASLRTRVHSRPHVWDQGWPVILELSPLALPVASLPGTEPERQAQCRPGLHSHRSYF